MVESVLQHIFLESWNVEHICTYVKYRMNGSKLNITLDYWHLLNLEFVSCWKLFSF